MGSAHTERLETLLASSNSASDPAVKGALIHLSTEISERLTRGSTTSLDFFRSAAKVVAEIRGSAHFQLRVSCLFDCCRYFYLGGHRPEALSATAQFMRLAVQTQDKQSIFKACTMRGIVEADSGNVAEALVHYSEGLQIACETGDLERQAKMLINIGVALNYAGLYREAIPCFYRSVEIVENLPSREDRLGNALANVAQSHYYLEQYEEAMAAITRCLEMTAEPKDANNCLDVVIRESTFVQIALALGQIEAARRHSKICSQYGRQDHTLRARFSADLALALCETYGGDVPKGLEQLEDMLLMYGQGGSSRSDILLALVKAYDLAAKPELALLRMKDLLSHFRMTRTDALQDFLISERFSSKEDLSFDSGLRVLELAEARLRARVAERIAQDSQIEMLERLAVTADLKEEASGEHGYRVGKLAALLASDLGWPDDACHAIELAARVHDIGKIGVPDRILLNSKALQEAERNIMSMHTTIGSELLAKSSIPQLKMAEEIARCHHEWWNGEGYPSKLAGRRIPLHARIVAVADVFDALTHGRPFAKPWTIDDALAEVANRSGTQFDPELTERFLALLARLRSQHEDLDAYLGQAGKFSPFLQARNKIRMMLADGREGSGKTVQAGNTTRH
jgi:putative two-component system response regulator